MRQVRRQFSVVIVIVGVAVSTVGCRTAHESDKTPTGETATVSAGRAELPFLATGESDADRTRDELSGLSWSALDAKLGWHVLHPVGRQFVRHSWARQVYFQRIPLYVEQYSDLASAPASDFGPVDIDYVEGPEVRPGYEDVAGSVWTEEVAGFSVRVHQLSSRVSGFFSTGQSFDGASVEARVDARSKSSLRDFIAQLVTE